METGCRGGRRRRRRRELECAAGNGEARIGTLVAVVEIAMWIMGARGPIAIAATFEHHPHTHSAPNPPPPSDKALRLFLQTWTRWEG